MMRTALLTFVVGGLVATSALADSDPAAEAMVVKIMKRLDADKDGKISRAEASGRERLAKNFDKIDSDHDGFISHAEMTVVVERRLAKQRSHSDF